MHTSKSGIRPFCQRFCTILRACFPAGVFVLVFLLPAFISGQGSQAAELSAAMRASEERAAAQEQSVSTAEPQTSPPGASDSGTRTSAESEPAPQTFPDTAEEKGSADMPLQAADHFDYPDAFSPSILLERARALADQPYARPNREIPSFLRELSERQWKNIRYANDKTIWKNVGLDFEIEPIHPGFIYHSAVAIHLVQGDRSGRLRFSSTDFTYPDDALAARTEQSAIDFAGFGIRFPFSAAEPAQDFVTFLGATHFRSRGKNSDYGLSARGLSLNAAEADGEIFPYFREFWLVKPEPDESSITLYALLDAPGMTGISRFVITPGTSTVMDVETTLFMRSGSPAPRKIGIAPMASMFLYSETSNGPFNGFTGDYRPEIHNSDGFLFANSEGEWQWTPLANPSRLAIHTFAANNPRGFGLFQRDNVFDHYQDIDARFERRSSLWVEPRGEWGAGRLELIEIPGKEEVHENINAFWVPETVSDAMTFGYRLYWMAPGVTPHELGKAVSTRIVRAPKSDIARFIIEFESPALIELPAETGLASVIETPEEAPLLEKLLMKNPVTGGWRLSFRARVPSQEGVVQSIITAREGAPRLRFKALLKRGENLPDALTETWTYDFPF